MGDYMRQLFVAVYSLVEDNPTIFVGRAAHLMVPRDRVLAVRLISSKENRAKRVAGILGISMAAARMKLDEEDKLQNDFFRKNFKKKDASPYEFDLVINRGLFCGCQMVRRSGGKGVPPEIRKPRVTQAMKNQPEEKEDRQSSFFRPFFIFSLKPSILNLLPSGLNHHPMTPDAIMASLS